MDLGLVERIRRFVNACGASRTPGPPPPGFDALVREAFAFQVERIGPVRSLARARGIDPSATGRPASWRETPAVPALAFKSLDLFPEGADPDRALTFRSSGTSSADTERRSVHRHPFPELYRETIDASFPARCLPPGGPGGEGARVPMLSLIPARAHLPDSSLSFMVDHVVERWGAADSAYGLGPGGLDAEAAAAWLRSRERSSPEAPCLVLATAFALAELLDRLEETGTRLELPADSVLFETGGFKGRSRELSRSELAERVEESLGLESGRIVREYGMTELTSQLYTRALEGGDPDLFVPPPWCRIRVLDPETLGEAEPGSVGLIAILDLANLGSALHLLTDDLGAMEAGGLRLAGRARGAELRGCSLSAEEMAAPGGGSWKLEVRSYKF